jgi:prephenate dehydrogenase
MPVRIAIVGLGMMGGSLALALGRARPDLELIGTDVNPVTMGRAVDMGAVRQGDPETADVIFLAVPISAMSEVLAGLSGCQAVITDMASTKVSVTRWATAAGVDLIGGHPICGKEQSGLEAADPAIFQGAPWVVTRRQPALWDLIEAVGARPRVMAPELHDRLMAGVSHCAFAVSVAYLRSLLNSGEWSQMAEVAGPGFRDMTRLAAGDPYLYAAIAATNRQPMVQALQAVEESLSQLRRQVEAGDSRLVEVFEDAQRARSLWSKKRELTASSGENQK